MNCFRFFLGDFLYKKFFNEEKRENKERERQIIKEKQEVEKFRKEYDAKMRALFWVGGEFVRRACEMELETSEIDKKIFQFHLVRVKKVAEMTENQKFTFNEVEDFVKKTKYQSFYLDCIKEPPTEKTLFREDYEEYRQNILHYKGLDIGGFGENLGWLV